MRNLLCKVIMVWICLFFSMALYSQPMDVVFEYDGSGNRILREKLYLHDGTQEGGSGEIEKRTNSEGTKETQTFTSHLKGREIFLYPNPTRGRVEVAIGKFNSEVDSGNWILVSEKGSVLIHGEELTQRIQLDLSKFSSGRYILKIQLNGSSKEWIIVKE